MSSFDLKPQIQISAMTRSVDEILWTQPRDGVPPLLQGRISLSTWQTTFDKVANHYQSLIQQSQQLKPWIYIPCCVCCIMPKMISIMTAHQEGWAAMVQDQAKVYQGVGVQVALAKEIRSTGTGSHRGFSMDIVGLHFDIAASSSSAGGAATTAAAAPANPYITPTATAVPVPSSSVPTAATTTDAASRLKRLEDLYRNGTITQQEYNSNRQRILAEL